MVLEVGMACCRGEQDELPTLDMVPEITTAMPADAVGGDTVIELTVTVGTGTSGRPAAIPTTTTA
jgi:hypothetical protein